MTNKKLKVFVGQQLPLLLSKGHLPDIAEFRNIAENCKTQRDSLVRITPQTGYKQLSPDIVSVKTITRSTGPGEIRIRMPLVKLKAAPDPRHVKAVTGVITNGQSLFIRCI